MSMQEQYSTTMDNLFAASQIMPVDADSLQIASSQNLKRGSLVNASGALIGDGTAAVAASGTATFSANPSANDTLTVDGSVLKFVSSSPDAGEVKIESELAGTLDNVIAALPASVVGSKSAGVLTITAAQAGTAGNSIAIAKSSSAITLSGAALSGGQAGSLDLDVYAVLAEDVDTTDGAKKAAVYLTGDYNENALIVDTSKGASVADCKVNARKIGIFIKSVVSY